MKKKTLGMNATAGRIFFAQTHGSEATFEIEDAISKHIKYDIGTDLGLLDLQTAASAVIAAARAAGVDTLAVLTSTAGTRGSAAETIKAEGIVELVAAQAGLKVARVWPQSLKSALNCGSQQWRNVARRLWNPSGEISQWANKVDGAVAAAFKAAKG